MIGSSSLVAVLRKWSLLSVLVIATRRRRMARRAALPLRWRSRRPRPLLWCLARIDGPRSVSARAASFDALGSERSEFIAKSGARKGAANAKCCAHCTTRCAHAHLADSRPFALPGSAGKSSRDDRQLDWQKALRDDRRWIDDATVDDAGVPGGAPIDLIHVNVYPPQGGGR